MTLLHGLANASTNANTKSRSQHYDVARRVVFHLPETRRTGTIQGQILRLHIEILAMTHKLPDESISEILTPLVLRVRCVPNWITVVSSHFHFSVQRIMAHRSELSSLCFPQTA